MKTYGALVTGASGFIGTRLVRKLQEYGAFAFIRATDILPPREILPGVDYQTWDVRERADTGIADAVEVVFNLAAVHRSPGHAAHEYYDTNILGALNTVELASRADIPAIVFASSISVYGSSEGTITEQTPTLPHSEYGKSKLLAERIHADWSDRNSAKLVTVRPGVVFGPGERGNYARLAQALRSGYFAYPGRRDTIKASGYVDELVRSMLFAYSHEAPQITYNFCYPQSSTMEQIVEAFHSVAGWSTRPPTIPLRALLAAARVLEILNGVGVRNPVHRERVMKLVQSTNVSPRWLIASGYKFETSLQDALALWADESHGRFT